MTTLFAFLQVEWPAVYEAADKAAAAAHPDPRTACFYARRALELTVAWAYKSDASLRLPYQDNLIAPRGPDDIFTSTQIDELIALLDHITATAVAA